MSLRPPTARRCEDALPGKEEAKPKSSASGGLASIPAHTREHCAAGRGPVSAQAVTASGL